MLERECIFRCGNAVDGSPLSVREDFVLLASCASRDVVGYPGSHQGPPESLCHLTDGFISARVSGGWEVVEGIHDLSFEM